MQIDQVAVLEKGCIISVPSIPMYNFDQDFTIQALIQPAQPATPGMIISKVNTQTQVGYYLVILYNGMIEFNMYSDDRKLYQRVSSVTCLLKNRCHYLTVIRCGDEISMMVDGAEVAVGGEPLQGMKLSNLNNEPLRIGGPGYGGYIANVALWNRALSPAEVLTSINQDIDATKTIGCWRLNGDTVDSSPYHNSGQIGKRVCFTDAYLDLPYTGHRQRMSLWCWAAVATNTSLFYDPNSQCTQCCLAGKAFGKDCCHGGSLKDCNKANGLDWALTQTGNFSSWSPFRFTFDFLRKQIIQWRVVGVCIQFQFTTGIQPLNHFIAVTGTWSGKEQYLTVKDPFEGSSMIPYSTLYRYPFPGFPEGEWVGTYFTKPCGGGSSNAD